MIPPATDPKRFEDNGPAASPWRRIDSLKIIPEKNNGKDNNTMLVIARGKGGSAVNVSSGKKNVKTRLMNNSRYTHAR